MACRFHDCHLHAEADAEIGNLTFTSELGRTDLAFGTALAKAAGMPLCVLLGGSVGSVRAYNSNGLWLKDPEATAAEAIQLRDEGGFEGLKLRLGRDRPRDDIATIEAVRKAVGNDVALMVDFNQALSVNEAILRGRMLDDEGGLLWIEEPIRADDFDGNARVAAALDTPLQIGENFMGPEQMAQALAARACDFVMPDLERIGGVTGWIRAAALAQAAGCEMSSHLFPEVSVHLLAATPTCHYLEYVDWADKIVEQPLRIADGFAVAPDRPGNGLSWDKKAVEKYRIA